MPKKTKKKSKNEKKKMLLLEIPVNSRNNSDISKITTVDRKPN